MNRQPFNLAVHAAYQQRAQTTIQIIQQMEQRRRHAAVLLSTSGITETPMPLAADVAEAPALLLQAVIVPETETAEGTLVAAVALPWFDIVEMISKDPASIWQIDWRKWEEIVAAAYKRQGFDVILTPRSNDKGRDVIASSRGIGCVRYVDQVKAYAPDHRVTAAEVRELVGVLALDPNVSKGFVTTTADFAPGIEADEDIRRWMPYRLELKPRSVLLEWLRSLALIR